MKRSGFTLVELSIVLVIIGLLTGGILAGQSLIRAAELKAVTTEFSKYTSAVNAFRDKYQALPGDMNNASSFWTAIPTTSNGNGNGILEAAAAINTTGETEQFWNELALAGLIEGTYTGIAGPNGTGWLGNDQIPGTNCPKSRLTNGAWGTGYNTAAGGSGTNYNFNFGNFLGFGAINPGSIPDAAVLKPEEAWNIDTKFDDGKPGAGRIFARDVVGFGVAGSCTTSANANDFTGAYNLQVTGIACAFKFLKI